MQQLPSADLYGRIINRINYEERLLSLKRRIFCSCVGLIFSIGALVPVLKSFYLDMQSSGLLEMLSLSFTDFSIVLSNFGDYAMSILESVPVQSSILAALVFTVSVFCFSKIFDFAVDFRRMHNSLPINQ